MTEIHEPDLLYGAPAIAAHMGLTQRTVYHLHECGEFPTFKIGGKVCARRSTINNWLAEIEQSGMKEKAR
ncbi:DNA-binding protein [Rhizobium pusense]|uniref:helix-turn-helix transcriptional regulator n=1 Tax=Agrobacterium pusense TaxID=648995 RepID=UPI00244B555F|nr:DNA-binding protein [Agrobacterium pusense]MDH2091130.1 DNA-binding protein [Agrobacterium pusense]